MRKGFLSLLFLLAFCAVRAQRPSASSGRIERIDSFRSRYVDARNIDVWLPDGYPNAGRYAVLYLHDGQMLFDSNITWNKQEWMADEAAGRLQATKQTIPFVIVAIPNNGKWRRSEFFPEKARAFLPHPAVDSLDAEVEGRYLADEYLSFLVKELKPAIDKRYRTYTDPAHTFLAGSSMGGLISLYGLCEYPHVFGGAACLSTHWPGSLKQFNDTIPAAIRKYLDRNLPKAGSRLLYMDHGDRTLDALYPPLQAAADKLLAQKGYRSPRYVSYYFRGTDHSEKAWAARLEVAMEFLLGSK